MKTLLENPEVYEKISENGYQFVKSNYNWERVNEQLAQIIAG